MGRAETAAGEGKKATDAVEVLQVTRAAFIWRASRVSIRGSWCQPAGAGPLLSQASSPVLNRQVSSFGFWLPHPSRIISSYLTSHARRSSLQNSIYQAISAMPSHVLACLIWHIFGRITIRSNVFASGIQLLLLLFAISRS